MHRSKQQLYSITSSALVSMLARSNDQYHSRIEPRACRSVEQAQLLKQ
jgi:hypothetical protein